MALEFQPIAVVFDEGLAEKSDSRSMVPGALRRAVNVEFDKAGRLNKRRGYRRVVLDEIIGLTVESVHVAVFAWRGELLLHGETSLYAVHNIAAGSGAIVARGRVCRGNGDTVHIIAANISEEQV
jgi:hypothetical protein